jgi:hypothetical protein
MEHLFYDLYFSHCKIPIISHIHKMLYMSILCISGVLIAPEEPMEWWAILGSSATDLAASPCFLVA